ncbi:unnamed protein product [Callosobruchus maculatus]|uniref:Protein TsetseEP domain-containing protein n=1 Tax=Callosobruchus maculatus TaxID=64391 RepID=A0A653BMN1_CALMS|nr:unnamed protein product [Callosobruchus maculatus]
MTSKNVVLLYFVVLCALFLQVESEKAAPKGAPLNSFLGLDVDKIALEVKKTITQLVNDAAKNIDNTVYRVEKALSNISDKCFVTLQKWADGAEVRLAGVYRTVVDLNNTLGICLINETISKIKVLPAELCQLGVQYKRNATEKLNVFEWRAKLQLIDLAMDADVIVDKGVECAKEAGLISFKCSTLMVSEVGHAVLKIPGQIAKFLTNVDGIFKAFRDNGFKVIQMAMAKGEDLVNEAVKCAE